MPVSLSELAAGEIWIWTTSDQLWLAFILLNLLTGNEIFSSSRIAALLANCDSPASVISLVKILRHLRVAILATCDNPQSDPIGISTDSNDDSCWRQLNSERRLCWRRQNVLSSLHPRAICTRSDGLTNWEHMGATRFSNISLCSCAIGVGEIVLHADISAVKDSRLRQLEHIWSSIITHNLLHM